MVKRVIYILLAALIVFTGWIIPVSASNTQSTSYTFTYSINGKVELSQDAYLPSASYLDLGLKEPQDLYITDGKMYIADKGNKRILIVDIDTSKVSSIGEGLLEEPVGVSADSNGRIYVADFKKNEAYRFDKDGNLEFTFKKPETPNFGKSQGFNPKKIAPADDGGIYLISEGSTAGIIHMNGTGDFLGYFASNEVDINLFQKLQDFFLTHEQKKSFLRRTPPSFGNIFRGYDGLIYTINKGKDTNIKKHSISGIDLLKNTDRKVKMQDPADIFVTEDGRMYILQGDGSISELTYDGYLISTFSGSSDKTDRIGLFEVPTGIGVDSNNNVYVLDEQKAFIQVFAPTPTQTNIHKALDYYNNGLYDSSKKLWDDVLKFNNTSFLAHLYIGRIYMQETSYEKALEHFKIARVKDNYSTAYWEIRNIWLQKNLGSILINLICLYVTISILKLINKRKDIFQFARQVKGELLKSKLIRDMVNLKFAMYHPIDNAYDIKVDVKGSYASATIVYIILLILLILKQVASGFIFSADIANYSLFNTIMSYALIMGLFMIGNYFISSINDGNGTIKSIYIGTAYSFAPAILIMPFIILIANFSTINEQFFMSAAITIIITWCVINIILMLMEIHEYNFKSTMANILMTLFFMGVTVLAASMIYLLLKQIWGFLAELVTEVLLRGKAG